jgi:hypothetical protein
MTAKFYRVELKPEQKTSTCPICETLNNHIANANNCHHVAKITTSRVVLYYRNFDPRVAA